MSASLVGSEMCIRDSLESPCIAGRGRRKWTAACTPSGRLASGSAGGGAPVSYTHLTLPTICSV
eukprot:10751350-Alexandrium_andersonii.AAC.1